MSGKSDMSKGCMKYYRKLVSGLLLVGGSFLILEHLLNFGGFDIELLGHEWYGLCLVVMAMLLSLNWGQVRGVRDALRDRNIHKLLDEGER